MANKLVFAAATVVLSSLFSATAANLWYRASNEACSWDDKSAWLESNSAAHNALPNRDQDYLLLNNDTISLPNSLHVTNGTDAACADLKIGEAKMDDGRTVCVSVEGGTLRAGKIFVGYDGNGKIVFSGGTIRFADEFQVGVNEGAYGEVEFAGGVSDFTTASTQMLMFGLRGYGVLRGYGQLQQTRNGILALGDSAIVADGGGEERMLDLSYVTAVSNMLDGASFRTNGWYAVNKGMLAYPGSWFRSGGQSVVVTCAVGCDSKRETPDLVNSVVMTGQGFWDDHSFLQCRLCATDRSDVYLDALPANVKALTVWKLGVFNSTENTTPRGFSSAAVKFRYDLSKVRVGQEIRLFRWNGTAWDRVATATVSTENPVISASGLTPVAQTAVDKFTLGTFALTRVSHGCVIFVR